MVTLIATTMMEIHRPIDPIPPVALAELILASALRRKGDLVALQPEGELTAVLLTDDNVILGEIWVPADVGAATATRLALIAGLDPLVDASSAEGRGNVAQVKVRAGDEIGEVLISVRASANGLNVDVRPLSGSARTSKATVVGHLKRCPRCNTFQPAQRDRCERDRELLEEVIDNPVPGGTIGVYRIHELLGEGGMGTVFAAEHALIGRPAAIKLIHKSFAETPSIARSFLTEARAASRLHHPNIVEVTDFGLLRDNTPYIVMERLSGESLEARLARSGALSASTALRIGREVALALEAAHNGGVLHNDLKPANILLLDGSSDEVPRLKLLDFGAASLTTESGDGDGLWIGTPEYMAPERASGGAADARADLYSLGTVLYEMLGGNLPFGGPTARTVLAAQVGHPPPPLASPHGVLPQVAVRLVERALAKRPSERHQTAAEMIADIDRAIAATSRTGWRMWLP